MRSVVVSRHPPRRRNVVFPPKPRSASCQQGVSLLEVLITVVVLSIGLLGLAALQANATKFNHSAHLRSQATNMAHEMMERMRANTAIYPTAPGLITNLPNTFNAGSGPACGVSLGQVTVVGDPNPWTRDVNQWKSCIENALPTGRGRIRRLAANEDYTDECGTTHAGTGNPVVAIEVTWDESRLQAGASGCVVLRTEVRPL